MVESEHWTRPCLLTRGGVPGRRRPGGADGRVGRRPSGEQKWSSPNTGPDHFCSPEAVDRTHGGLEARGGAATRRQARGRCRGARATPQTHSGEQKWSSPNTRHDHFCSPGAVNRTDDGLEARCGVATRLQARGWCRGAGARRGLRWRRAGATSSMSHDSDEVVRARQGSPAPRRPPPPTPRPPRSTRPRRCPRAAPAPWAPTRAGRAWPRTSPTSPCRRTAR
jgi:hypothetical protein